MNATYALLKILSRLACSLSERGACRMGKILGRIFWFFVPARRKKMSVNNILRAGITKDKREAKEISEKADLRFGPLGVSVLRFPLLTEKNISKYVTIRNREKLDALAKEHKGCIIAASHCGNWEMMGAGLALHGYPLLSVGMKQSNEGFDKFICEYRSMTKQKVEYKTGVRDMLRHLKKGYFVGLLYDQDPGNTGIISDLFGQGTLTPTGPAHFSIMTGLPVMVLFIHQTGAFTYEIIVEDSILPEEKANKKEEVQRITDLLNKKLETWIRKYPEEWFWMHNRWKWTDRLYGGSKETQ